MNYEFTNYSNSKWLFGGKVTKVRYPNGAHSFERKPNEKEPD